MIVPLTDIHMPCHLSPVHYGRSVPLSWTKAEIDVMEKGEVFALNTFSSVWFHAFCALSGAKIIAGLDSYQRFEIVDEHSDNDGEGIQGAKSCGNQSRRGVKRKR